MAATGANAKVQLAVLAIVVVLCIGVIAMVNAPAGILETNAGL